MIQAVSGEMAKQRRIPSGLPGRQVSGRRPGRVWLFGKRVEQVEDHPQAYVVEMEASAVIAPHFHLVDEFQVVVGGSGSFGRNAVPAPIALHYVDHHTAYGPINSSACGLSYFTIRAKSDPGGIHLDTPESKAMLHQTRKRHLLPTGIGISTEPVLAGRTTVALENLLGETDSKDGLGGFMLRMGGGMKTTGPDPKPTGGQYYLVVNGTMQLDGVNYGPWSTAFATPDDAPLEVSAGSDGLEVMILNFPRPEA